MKWFAAGKPSFSTHALYFVTTAAISGARSTFDVAGSTAFCQPV